MYSNDPVTAIRTQAGDRRLKVRQDVAHALMDAGDLEVRTARAQRVWAAAQADIERLRENLKQHGPDLLERAEADLFDMTRTAGWLAQDRLTADCRREAAQRAAASVRTDEQATALILGALRRSEDGGMNVAIAGQVALLASRRGWGRALDLWLSSPWGARRGGTGALARVLMLRDLVLGTMPAELADLQSLEVMAASMGLEVAQSVVSSARAAGKRAARASRQAPEGAETPEAVEVPEDAPVGDVGDAPVEAPVGEPVEGSTGA